MGARAVRGCKWRNDTPVRRGRRGLQPLWDGRVASTAHRLLARRSARILTNPSVRTDPGRQQLLRSEHVSMRQMQMLARSQRVQCALDLESSIPGERPKRAGNVRFGRQPPVAAGSGGLEELATPGLSKLRARVEARHPQLALKDAQPAGVLAIAGAYFLADKPRLLHGGISEVTAPRWPGGGLVPWQSLWSQPHALRLP